MPSTASRPSPRRRVPRLAALLAPALLVAATLPSAAPFEKPDLSADKLRELATHVVVGEVRAVSTRTTEAGGWETTHVVHEVAVEAVEKTTDPPEGVDAASRPQPAPGALVYVRSWHRRWTGWGAPPPDTNGHRGIPETGARVRLYLARDAYDGFTKTNTDGGFNVIGCNGFEALPPRGGDDDG